MKLKTKAMAVVLSLTLSLSVVMMSCNAQTVQAYINLAVGIAIQVAQLAGAPKSAADKVAADLATVNKLIADYNAADSAGKQGVAVEIDTVLNVAEQDLGSIFQLTGVKNPKVQTVVQAAIAIGITAIESIRALAIKNAAPSATAHVAHTVTLGMAKGRIQTPQQLKNLYNLTVADYPQAQLH